MILDSGPTPWLGYQACAARCRYIS